MEAAERTVAARKLRPFYGRILAVRSGVDQEQRESGLIVPLSTGEGDGEVIRGVITAIDQDGEGGLLYGTNMHRLAVGMVIYYLAYEVHTVLDFDVLDASRVLAFEDDDG